MLKWHFCLKSRKKEFIAVQWSYLFLINIKFNEMVFYYMHRLNENIDILRAEQNFPSVCPFPISFSLSLFCHLSTIPWSSLLSNKRPNEWVSAVAYPSYTKTTICVWFSIAIAIALELQQQRHVWKESKMQHKSKGEQSLLLWKFFSYIVKNKSVRFVQFTFFNTECNCSDFNFNLC